MVRSRLIGMFGTLAWLAAAFLGYCALVRYDGTPGVSAAPVERIAGTSNRTRIVLFAHPHCPCTRTAIERLNHIAREPGRIADVEICFVLPNGAGSDWRCSENVRFASTMANVTVRWDIAGRESSLHGATTSGHVVAIAPKGSPLFHGGITPARSHPGSCAGFDAVLAIARGEEPSTCSAPVFGCPLEGPECHD